MKSDTPQISVRYVLWDKPKNKQEQMGEGEILKGGEVPLRSRGWLRSRRVDGNRDRRGKHFSVYFYEIIISEH